jgi:putative chitinase
MPNIIGEQIPGYVAKQINKRQKAHGSGHGDNDRTPEYIQYLNSKTAWVKLASGINISDKRAANEALRSGLNGTQLAKEYVLFNGTSDLSKNGQTDSNGKIFYPLQQRDSFERKYNVNATETGFSEFGYVPMPGIESAEIKCLTRGSIKRATVKIKCYSPEQFQILDLLYLRIGYTMLLEWGNSLYLDNNSDRLEQMGYTLIESENGFFSDTVKTYYDMLNKIKTYREDKFGNYDALVARVVNFSWQFAQDGSYDITLELISMGDVIESLKTNISPNSDMLSLIDPLYNNTTSTSQTNTQIVPPTSNTLSSYLYYQSILDADATNHSTEKIYIEAQGTPTQVGHFVKPVAGGVTIPLGMETLGPYNSETEAKQAIQDAYPGAVENTSDISRFILNSNPLLSNEYWIHPRNYTVYYQPESMESPFSSVSTEYKEKNIARINYNNTATTDYTFGYYMRFGHLLEFLQKYIVPNIQSNNQTVAPFLKIDSGTYGNLMHHFPFQVSLDPQVCIVNNLDENVGTKQYYHQLKRWIHPTKPGAAFIMDIYIHHQTIDRCLRDNLDGKGNLSLFNFLNSICLALNKALGGINQLEPIIDADENTIRIMDNNYYEPKQNKYGLELYGYNPDKKYLSSNFVRNFNLKTEITPEFANMASISSTAGGYVKGVENTMFSKWDWGLDDRLQPEVSAPVGIQFTSSRDEVKQTYLRKFWWAHNSAFGMKDSGIELDPQIIENNVSIVSEFYKAINSEIQLRSSGSYASPTNGFIPINLGVTMDGISGIKIYNELNISTKFLPRNYPENLHFIIKGVNHKLSNSDWETSVETVVIANSEDAAGKYMKYEDIRDEVLDILGETGAQISSATGIKTGKLTTQMIQVMNSFNILDTLERAHFLAQMAQESGNYTQTKENLRYTTIEQLDRIFGTKLPQNDLASYLNNAEKLGNKVYANKNGNGDVASGDGYRYRGRGYIQLTGKNNYIAFNNYLRSKGIQDDVVADPDLVSTKYPLEASVYWWIGPTLGASSNISKVAKHGSTPQDVLNVTKIVAGPNPDQSNINGKIQYFNYYYQMLLTQFVTNPLATTNLPAAMIPYTGNAITPF